MVIAKQVDCQKQSLPNDLSVDELGQRCRQETNKFLSGKPYDEAYGLELFRRAILDRDQAAWNTIYAQYQTLVAHWVKHHTRFQSTNEDAMFFVNATFARFWYTVSKHQAQLNFEGLASLLTYLKVCAHSVIEDECRQQRRLPQDALAWDDLSEVVTGDSPSPEAQAIDQMVAEVLRQVVVSRLRGEEEQVVAVLSWVYGLWPREIRACRPDLFTHIDCIYRIKRNLLNRLHRDPTIQQLRADRPTILKNDWTFAKKMR